MLDKMLGYTSNREKNDDEWVNKKIIFIKIKIEINKKIN